ncbi:MAG: phospholipid/cholesterol/gamma-HCH transport system ATP-binding protein [Planctomycetota bacterium]|jgi:phospholipid/cholesterol/gamma-HCH transport system ATP-binding protein
MIELQNVHKRLGGRDILKGLSVKIPKGVNYVLMGPSGTGKSVTLKHVIGIFKPDQGHVFVDGQDVPAMDQKQLMALRKRMGYLFQNGALINWLSVGDNVALPLREHSRISKSEVDDRVHKVLKLVGMDQAAKQAPPDISGGMKLRAGLARALVTNPEYVLYDEPNAGLDPIISHQIHELIAEVRDTLSVTGLIVTHSRACATQCGDRIGILEGGDIGIEGSVDEITNSDHPLARAFMGMGSD